MQMVKQNNNRYAPDTWRFIVSDGTPAVGYTCPNGHAGSLSDHDIAENGMVAPSVVCPAPGCGFHEYIQLEGWPGSEK